MKPAIVLALLLTGCGLLLCAWQIRQWRRDIRIPVILTIHDSAGNTWTEISTWVGEGNSIQTFALKDSSVTCTLERKRP